MRELLIKKASSSFVAAMALIFLLIFIAAMKQRPLQNKTYSYLALGDSYTIGEGVAIKESFPHQVVIFCMQKVWNYETSEDHCENRMDNR